MSRCRPRRVLYALVTAAPALGTTVAVAGTSSAATSASAPKLVTSPASLVNPFIGTSGAVGKFPGPDMPFGMIQWTPDPPPDPPEGGDYQYNGSQLPGYSLTRLIGPGCSVNGNLQILH